jgi:uncharacterized protein (DUF849 family)
VADKHQCPGIQYTPEEYAKEVRRARDAGTMVHIHAREPNGTPTVQLEHYRAITRAALGGNVRVGFEVNFYLPSGEMASSNGDLVEAAASIVRLQGRQVAEPDEARALLSLPTEPQRSGVA